MTMTVSSHATTLCSRCLSPVGWKPRVTMANGSVICSPCFMGDIRNGVEVPMPKPNTEN